jgi:hypothetical protein
MLLDEYTPAETDIFARILDNAPKQMSKALARHVLTLGFSDADQARMLDLAERNQDDLLSPAEHRELFRLVRATHFLALLHVRARRVLKMKPPKPIGARRG